MCTGFPGLGAECSFFFEWCLPYDNLLIHTLDLCVSVFLFYFSRKKKENHLLEEREKVLDKRCWRRCWKERERVHTNLDKTQVLRPISSMTVGE